MSAVGGYSGPRAICGVVAQPAENAAHVAAAIRRNQIDNFGGLEFMGFSVLTRIGHKWPEISHDLCGASIRLWRYIPAARLPLCESQIGTNPAS